MEINPIHIDGSCVASDDELIANMKHTITRGLPEIEGLYPVREGSIAIVASGPSVVGQLEALLQYPGRVVAVRDAHDWMIRNGRIPDYALTVDPLANSWHCFELKNPDVQYVIGSQCNAAVFDHLAGQKVLTFHTYMKDGQTEPAGKFLMPGLSTSGLRAIAVFYCLGWRNFNLFGFDSCLKDGKLRVNGTTPTSDEEIVELRIDPDGEKFYANMAMTLQAQQFLDIFDMMPGIHVETHGEGLIPAILAKYRKQQMEIEQEAPHEWNGRVSFIHPAGPEMASYRYRTAMPANELGASINDLTASILVFSKPNNQHLMDLCRAKARGQKVIVDFCDDHFKWMCYTEFLRRADMVVCPTERMREIISKVRTYGRSDAVVIPDPYEYPLAAPHCHGVRCLWFGHSINRASLLRILPDIEGYPLRVVGNFDNAIPWSHETMLREFATADVVLMPSTDEYKSANRTVEAIRQGCFVIAEPHPAIKDFPGIWIGNIKEGLEWLKRRPLPEVSSRILRAQRFVTERYSPPIVASAWSNVIQSLTTSALANANGPDGSASVLEIQRT